MQNNLKKIGVIGACLVAMIGTGGCLTALAVMAVKDKIDSNRYQHKITRNLSGYYLTFANKIKNNTATGADYLAFAHVNHDKKFLAQINQPTNNVEQQYRIYLNKAGSLGDENAKIEAKQLEFFEKLPNIYPWKSIQDDIPRVTNEQALSVTLKDYQQIANYNPQFFCKLFPISVNQGFNTTEMTPENLNFGSKELIGRLTENKFSPQNYKNFQIVLLQHKMLCQTPDDVLDEVNSYRSQFASNKTFTVNINEYPKLVFYGAYFKLKPNPQEKAYLLGMIDESQKGEIESRINQLVKDYHAITKN